MADQRGIVRIGKGLQALRVLISSALYSAFHLGEFKAFSVTQGVDEVGVGKRDPFCVSEAR